MIEVGSQISKPTVLSILGTIPSGIGLDIAKNHTGIVVWDGKSVETYGFSIQEYDKQDYFAEYKMRREFKDRLARVVTGKQFAYCIVEDVYMGENFDTVRKLLALNTVMDELIFDGVCGVGNFVRWTESKWLSNLRRLYKPHGKLKSKVETQEILRYLGFDFLLQHEGDSPAGKLGIYYEDICDAMGMLLGVVAQLSMENTLDKAVKYRFSDVKMVYLHDTLNARLTCRDSRVSEEAFTEVVLNSHALEKDILRQAVAHPGDVLCAELPAGKLGSFGVRRKFKFYEDGSGYLFFYLKERG